MAPLQRLRKLHLVAHQDHILRTHTHCDPVGERNLSRLIDEQVIKLLVQFLSREEPSGSCNEIVSTLRRFSVVGRSRANQTE